MKRHKTHLTSAQMAGDPAANAMERAGAAVAAALGHGTPFAVVAWVPGKANEPGAVAVGGHPDFRTEVPHALATAAMCMKDNAGTAQ